MPSARTLACNQQEVAPDDLRPELVPGDNLALPEFLEATVEGRKVAIKGPCCTVRLAPGAGARLHLSMRRYVNRPTLAFPWDRGWAMDKEEK